MNNDAAKSKRRPPGNVEVTRDRKIDRGEGPKMPAPDGDAMRDEDYTDREKPLVEGSIEAKRLHRRPPKGKEQLRAGTAGDSARPSKSGIYGKPVPPRGKL